MKSSSIISIVIPVHNRADVVCRTLNSIAAQTVAPAAIFIVDNASTDCSMEVVKGWISRHPDLPCPVTILSEPRAGASVARNRGLSEVTTPHVMFFDSDDEMEFDHIERVVTALESNPATDLLHWGITYRDADGWTDVKESRPNHPDLLAEQIFHSSLSSLRYCVSTEFLRKAGAWNESLTTWDDYELGIRMLLLNPRVSYLPGTPRVIANESAASLTGPTYSSRAPQQAKAIKAVTALLAGHPLHRLLFRARCAVLAANYRREGARSLAAATLSEALAPYSGTVKLKLRLVYAAQRIFGRGASSLALQLLAPKTRHPEP